MKFIKYEKDCNNTNRNLYSFDTAGMKVFMNLLVHMAGQP